MLSSDWKIDPDIDLSGISNWIAMPTGRELSNERETNNLQNETLHIKGQCSRNMVRPRHKQRSQRAMD